jgi:hypothetical protein
MMVELAASERAVHGDFFNGELLFVIKYYLKHE